MKRKVLFVASLFLATATFAQDGLTSKKGEAILPEAGDWALGFDAAPFISYFGNLANGNTNNSMNAAWQTNDASIVGKYFKDEKTAYRGRVRIGFGSTAQDTNQDTSSTFTPVFVTGENSTSNFNIVLGGGIEKRKGNTRIQGYYGGEVLIAFASNSSETEYGIALSQNFQNGGNKRTLEISSSAFSFGLRGFVGVEWFVAPKVSLGAEYGWGLGFTSTGGAETDFEVWDASANAGAGAVLTGTDLAPLGDSTGFSLDTDNNGGGIFGGSGQINLIFHF